jgi:hypothetical protein
VTEGKRPSEAELRERRAKAIENAHRREYESALAPPEDENGPSWDELTDEKREEIRAVNRESWPSTKLDSCNTGANCMSSVARSPQNPKASATALRTRAGRKQDLVEIGETHERRPLRHRARRGLVRASGTIHAGRPRDAA